MQRKAIDPIYLRSIISPNVKDCKIGALEFANTLKRFIDQNLSGAMTVTVLGHSDECVNLKLSVVTYMIRLFCEMAGENEVIELYISLGDKLTMSLSFKSLDDHESVSHLIKTARLAGFDVLRDGGTLIFEASVSKATLQVYAASSDEFMDMLVLTHKM